jgi:hypothetical protein
MNIDQTTEEQLQTYLAQGYRHRTHYLESLCEEYDSETVYTLAVLLGPSEDFDGLITALEDAADDPATDAAYFQMLEECRHA